MDFILSKIISRPPRTVDVALEVEKTIDSISSDHEYMSFNICDMSDASSNDDEHTNKPSTGAAAPINKLHAAALESDLSGFDSTLSASMNESLDVSYSKNLNETCSDLVNNFDRLNVQHANDVRVLSSDEESFQECENDLETTIHTTESAPSQPTASNKINTVCTPTIAADTIIDLVTPPTVSVSVENTVSADPEDTSNESVYYDDENPTEVGNVSGSNSLQGSFVGETEANLNGTINLNVTAPVAANGTENEPLTGANTSNLLNLTKEGDSASSFIGGTDKNATFDEKTNESRPFDLDPTKSKPILSDSFSIVGNSEINAVTAEPIAPSINVVAPTSPADDVSASFSVPATTSAIAITSDNSPLDTVLSNADTNTPTPFNVSITPNGPTPTAKQTNLAKAVFDQAQVNSPLINSVASGSPSISHMVSPSVDVNGNPVEDIDELIDDVLNADDINDVINKSIDASQAQEIVANVDNPLKRSSDVLGEAMDFEDMDVDMNGTMDMPSSTNGPVQMMDCLNETIEMTEMPAMVEPNEPKHSAPSNQPQSNVDVNAEGKTVSATTSYESANSITEGKIVSATTSYESAKSTLSSIGGDQTIVGTADQTYVAPADQTYLEPTNHTFIEPGNETFAMPVNQTFVEPANATYVEPVNETFAMPTNQTFVEPANATYVEPVNETFAMPTNQTFIQPANETFVAPVNQTFAMPISNGTAAKTLNETVVIEENAGDVNSTYIAAADISPKIPKVSEAKDTSPSTPIEDLREKLKGIKDDVFKKPMTTTTTAANKPHSVFGDMKNQFTVSDDEFSSPSLILNPNDFDFLLSKGTTSQQINPRDSILERFDPILGRKSVVPASQSVKTDLLPTPTIPTIPEAEFSTTELSTINESDASLVSTDVKSNPFEVPLNNSSNSSINKKVVTKRSSFDEQIVKLDSSDTFDSNQFGDGDRSQASSTTETYETASSASGELHKADANMSVGLIQDMNMDNMKSLEQDIKDHQPSLQRNDEQKVKQEMSEVVERKLKEAEAREEALLRRITEREKALNKMSAVVENYEKTMVEMISEREQTAQNYEKQLKELTSERDSNYHHLMSLENTFSDLHIKYEKSKQMALEVRDKEAKLIEKLDFCQQQMKLQEQRYDKLKNHALAQLESANLKLETLSKTHSQDMKKLTAQLKKEEISRQSIMEQLAQKTKENEELVKICDELINNGGDAS